MHESFWRNWWLFACFVRRCITLINLVNSAIWRWGDYRSLCRKEVVRINHGRTVGYTVHMSQDEKQHHFKKKKSGFELPAVDPIQDVMSDEELSEAEKKIQDLIKNQDDTDSQ